MDSPALVLVQLLSCQGHSCYGVLILNKRIGFVTAILFLVHGGVFGGTCRRVLHTFHNVESCFVSGIFCCIVLFYLVNLICFRHNEAVRLPLSALYPTTGCVVFPYRHIFPLQQFPLLNKAARFKPLFVFP